MKPLAWLLLVAGAAAGAERWEIQYFHDEDDSELVLTDLAFPSPRRGIAIGRLAPKGGKPKPAALLTGDGGRTWRMATLPEAGATLFFLTESVGWMAARNALYKTEEGGASWTKLKAPPGILRVYFLDENRGFAAGLQKSIYATSDGGRTWTKVPAAAEPNTTPEYTVYGWIAFANEKAGIIAGVSRPPQPESRRRLPDWIDPEAAQKRREKPALTILLDTFDGGRTWRPQVTSLFGTVSRIRLASDGRGLGLIQFSETSEWPSEVFRIDWRTGKNTRIFRRRDRAVTDLALPPDGPAYLAAIEPQGLQLRLPVPGKLKILRSENLTDWAEMEVDYRAFGNRAMLACPAPGQVWAATDTGQILHLVSN